MNANIKKHDDYRCDKTLKSLDLKKKHIPLSHENVNPQLVYHWDREFLKKQKKNVHVKKKTQRRTTTK